jgi:hypothetical protein
MSEIGTANLKRAKAQRQLKPFLPASGREQAPVAPLLATEEGT